MTDEHPSVTVAIPALNEAGHIERVLQQFRQNNYPNLREILVADGGSTDGTRDLVKQISLTDRRIRLLDNPLQIQSAALKQMLAEAQGDVFLRADAHCEYAPDYVEKCVEALQVSQSLNAGGAQRFAAQNAFQAAIALAARSVLGSGGAKYRDPQYAGYADTVFLGCFWREALESVGGYKITRKEDTELNLRLLERTPKAIYISPAVRVWYYPRSNWRSFARQYCKYGRGSYLIHNQYPGRVPLRNRLPFYLLLALVGFALLDLAVVSSGIATLILIAVGGVAVGAEATRVVLQHDGPLKREIWRGNPEDIPPLLQRCWLCTLILLTMPVAHSWGYGYQLLRHKVLHQREAYFLEVPSAYYSVR